MEKDVTSPDEQLGAALRLCLEAAGKTEYTAIGVTAGDSGYYELFLDADESISEWAKALNSLALDIGSD